jgi:alpha-1,2-mannosyltransferase
MISWRLGQIQGLLDLLFAASCFCWLTERKAVAGILIGITCLIKPQFSLFLIWAVLRRQHGFAFGQAAALGAGLGLSLLLYGGQPLLDYIGILEFISRHGEIFWDNTSVNGLVNRLFYPNKTLVFDYHGWVPYESTVYIATLSSSLVIIATALFIIGRSGGRGSIFDFMTAAFCFTLASPIAWGHHFGITMPIFAVLLIALSGQQGEHHRKHFMIAAICFLAFSDDWNVTDLLAGSDLTILQSWRLFAAITLLWLLHMATTDSASLFNRAAAPAEASTPALARDVCHRSPTPWRST